MKKYLITALSILILSGCSLIAPYSITFTTPAQSAVDPLEDTLDLAITQPAMAYISGVVCEGHDPMMLLPVVSADMETSNVHNLSLELLNDYEATTACEVSVTAFDQSTTSTSTSSIILFVLEKPIDIEEVTEEEVIIEDASNETEEMPIINEDHAEEILSCNEAGGQWNECGSACEEGAELCIQVCVPQCEFADENNEEINTTSENEPEEVVENNEVNQDNCEEAGGEWHDTCEDDDNCSGWCEADFTEETNE